MNKQKELGTIGVLMGGYSSEKDISLKSGKAVYNALKKAGCQTVPLEINDADPHRINDFIKDSHIDVAFIALHGKLGEDGTIQTICEDVGIPYTGSGIKASQLAFDKALSQVLFRHNSIPVPEHEIILSTNGWSVDSIFSRLDSMPLIVKPSREGSSIGISIVRNKEDLDKSIEYGFQYGSEVIVERYIKGKEVTVGILANKALPVVEICSKNEFFDFQSKYEEGMTEYVVPAQLPKELTNKLQKIALRAHNVLSCKDFSRVDMLIDGSMNMYVIEINTIPGFTSTSLLPKAAQAAGLNFTELCLQLIRLAYGKKKQKEI